MPSRHTLTSKRQCPLEAAELMPLAPYLSRRQALISSLLLPLAAGVNSARPHAETAMSTAEQKH
jgi:hypothetical protein